jgi:hypothetical protein
MNKFISIGTQCTTADLLKRFNIRNESYPFDWVLSTPQFIYTIIKLLLVDKMDIEYIVDNHFFVCDARANCKIIEHYYTEKTGQTLVNTKYNVCFPHDTLEDRDKYVRRLERLRNTLLDENCFIYLIYVSVSSPTNGNYTLNGVETIHDLYEYIDKINDIMKSIRNTYKIVVFDTNKPPNVVPSDNEHMIYCDIQQQNWFYNMLPELVDKFNKLIETNDIVL